MLSSSPSYRKSTDDDGRDDGRKSDNKKKNKKLDYLSKYFQDERPTSTRRHDESFPRSKKRRRRNRHDHDNGADHDEKKRVDSMSIHDEQPDDDLQPLNHDPSHGEGAEEGEEEEDGPVVVMEVKEHKEMQPWESVDNRRDHYPPPENSRTRRRYDSSDEEQGHRQRKRNEITAASTTDPTAAAFGDGGRRRPRYDSEDDDDDEQQQASAAFRWQDHNDAEKPLATTLRHDSDDENEPSKKGGAGASSARSSNAGSGERRRRYDSSEDEEDNDADDEYDQRKDHQARTEIVSRPSDRLPSHLPTLSLANNKLNHTFEEADKIATSRTRYDSSDDDDQEKKRNKERQTKSEEFDRMSSGHLAGLQTSTDFSQTEATIQKRRKQEAMAMVEKHGMGETVYRNKASGQKVNVEEAANQARRGRQPTSRIELNFEEKRLLHTGRVQREQEEGQQETWARLQQSSFARHADDADLEEYRRNEIRAGDPMAAQAAKKRQNHLATGTSGPHSVPRPSYKGPPAKPNRFGIRPGYRWDGVDRSNGFEDRLLAQKYSRQHQREQAYRQSVADM